MREKPAMTQETHAWAEDPTEEIPVAEIQPEEEPAEDGLLADDDYLFVGPSRTSRVTIALVLLLVLALGFLIGVQVQKFAGASRPTQSTSALASPTTGG